MEEIVELMTHPEVALALNHRFSYVLSKEITVSELINGEYSLVSPNSIELTSQEWARFVHISYLNFAAFGFAAYYLQKVKTTNNESTVVPVGCPPGTYTATLSTDDQLLTTINFRLQGAIQPKRIFHVVSNHHLGLIQNGVYSELSVLLPAYRELKLAEETRCAAIRASLVQNILLQRTQTDPSRTLEEQEAKLDALVVSTLESTPHVDQKHTVRRDDQGFSWLPDGFQPSTQQPRQIDTALFDTTSRQLAFRGLVERALQIPTDLSRNGGLSTRSAAAAEESLSSLIACLRSVCSDLEHAIASAYEAINHTYPKVEVRFRTRITTDILMELHKKRVLTDEDLDRHLATDLGIKRARLLSEDQ